MSYARDLTTEQASMHTDMQNWVFHGTFRDGGETARSPQVFSRADTATSDNALCARFCDRLDKIVGSSLFDVDAFVRHVRFLSKTTGGDRLDALMRFKATVVAKHESLFPDDDEGDDYGGGLAGVGGNARGGTRCAIS